MVLCPECLGNHDLREVRTQTGKQQEEVKKAIIDARARQKKPVDMVTIPDKRWLDAESLVHKADRKKHCESVVVMQTMR